MSLQAQILDYALNNGIKKGFIAKQVDMSPSIFSLWLHNKYTANQVQESRIRDFLESQD